MSSFAEFMRNLFVFLGDRFPTSFTVSACTASFFGIIRRFLINSRPGGAWADWDFPIGIVAFLAAVLCAAAGICVAGSIVGYCWEHY